MTPADLQAWRLAHTLSQAEMAALLDVHEMTVSRWERGVYAIPSHLHLALEALDHRLNQKKPR